jgi:UDP-N-acetylmuramate dehydrogenase
MGYWNNGMLEQWNYARRDSAQHSNIPPFHYSNSAVTLTMIKTSDDSLLAAELKQIAGLRVKIDEPLARYTSMKIGGPADYFIEAQTDAALASLLPLLNQHAMNFCLLGNGSNVLISDRGVRGVVIRLAGEFKKIQWADDGERVHVNVGAAYAVTQLVREAARKGFAGLEFAEGIPGSVGGALFMNAGAYGSEFEKVVDQVEGATSQGQPICLSRGEMTFSYRDSHLPPGTIVTRVRMQLHKAESVEVGSKLQELVSRRKSSQPSGYPNSGSMFRNPPGDFAGRLIEAAGLKGKRIGQSQISERHANFIVNLGGARAADVLQLTELAQAEVRSRFGVELVLEVKLLGEWTAQ